MNTRKYLFKRQDKDVWAGGKITTNGHGNFVASVAEDVGGKGGAVKDGFVTLKAALANGGFRADWVDFLKDFAEKTSKRLYIEALPKIPAGAKKKKAANSSK
jgi:hypothetical protein